MKISKQPWLLLSKTIYLPSIFIFALVVPTSAQTTARQSSSVTGTVTDQRGDPIQGVTVSLIEPAGEKGKTALTDENGSFTIPAEASIFELQLNAPEFAVKNVHGELGSNQQLDLGRIGLTIQMATTEVRVSLTGEELAEEQVRTEERQRVLGVIPNYFVSYDHNAVALHAKQKYELAFRTLIDPETIGVDLASSGLQQGTGGLKGYGTGSDGYAKRFGAPTERVPLTPCSAAPYFPRSLNKTPGIFIKGLAVSSEGRSMRSACQLYVKGITDAGSTTIRVCWVGWRRAASQISTTLRLTGTLLD